MPITGSQPYVTQARFGKARFGATRFNAYAGYKWFVTINSTDRSSSILDGSVRIQQVLNDQPDTARFTLKSPVTFTLQAGQLVSIGLGSASNLEFGGQIARLTTRAEEGLLDYPFYDVECIDWARLLNRRLVTTRYTSTSATDIANDILNTYTSGFTGHAIEDGLPIIDDFPITTETVSSVFKRLADLIGGAYFIDTGRDLHLFGSAGDQSAYAGTNPLPLTSTQSTLKTLRFTSDIAQQRSRIKVGGKAATCPSGTPGSATTTGGVVDYLLVAGGGGGGNDSSNGGGGGGGGVLTGTDTLGVGAYSITIGGGGASNTNGSNSTYNGHTATGGGHGANSNNGTAGGSGGGADGNGGSGGAGTAGQGHNGGSSSVATAGAGGGGAGAAGNNGTFSTGGRGGNGLYSAINGTGTYYGGGGGGNGASGAGAGGLGGGGRAGAGGNPALAGTANTGGGGGGGDAGGGAAGAGGSGVCILSYPTAGTTATGGTITTSGSRTIHTFTSNGTFTVSSVTSTAPPTAVDDLPLRNAANLDAAGGVVLFGQKEVTYSSVGGAILDPGENPPGSSLSADVAIGATAMSVTSANSIFTESTGWVEAGGQIIRYTGTSATQLTGIPASGFGSIAAALKSGTAVTWLGKLVLSSSTLFDPPVDPDAEAIQITTVDDATAQTAIAAIEGGDGIHEDIVDDRRLTVEGATVRGNSDLESFAGEIIEAEWTTEDLNARAGRQQTISFGTLSATLLILESELFEVLSREKPWRRCVGSSVKQAGLQDVAVRKIT